MAMEIVLGNITRFQILATGREAKCQHCEKTIQKTELRERFQTSIGTAHAVSKSICLKCLAEQIKKDPKVFSEFLALLIDNIPNCDECSEKRDCDNCDERRGDPPDYSWRD